MSISQAKALQPKSYTSTQTNRATAESNWRDLRTFGDCHRRPMIGMRDDTEEPVPYERYEIRVSFANPSVAEAGLIYEQGGPGIQGTALACQRWRMAPNIPFRRTTLLLGACSFVESRSENLYTNLHHSIPTYAIISRDISFIGNTARHYSLSLQSSRFYQVRSPDSFHEVLLAVTHPLWCWQGW